MLSGSFLESLNNRQLRVMSFTMQSNRKQVINFFPPRLPSDNRKLILHMMAQPRTNHTKCWLVKYPGTILLQWTSYRWDFLSQLNSISCLLKSGLFLQTVSAYESPLRLSPAWSIAFQCFWPLLLISNYSPCVKSLLLIVERFF